MPFSVTIARYTAFHFPSHVDLCVCKAIHLPNEMRASCNATQPNPFARNLIRKDITSYSDS